MGEISDQIYYWTLKLIKEERKILNVKKLPKNHLNTTQEGYLNFMKLMQRKI